MKIRPVAAEFFRADGRKGRRTDMTTLIVTFRNIPTPPQKKKFLPTQYVYVFVFNPEPTTNFALYNVI